MLAFKNQPIYVDVQCLMSVEKGEIIKEITICRNDLVAWIIVNSPANLTQVIRPNAFATSILHRLNWSAGLISVDDLRNVTSALFKRNTPVYVKGLGKAKILSTFLNVSRKQISSLDHIPRLVDLRKQFLAEACPLHSHDSNLCCTTRHTEFMMRFH